MNCVLGWRKYKIDQNQRWIGHYKQHKIDMHTCVFDCSMEKSMKWIKKFKQRIQSHSKDTTDDWVKPKSNPINQLGKIYTAKLKRKSRDTTNDQVKPRIMNPITSTIRKKSRLLNPIAKQIQKMSGHNLNSESNQTAYQTRLIS